MPRCPHCGGFLYKPDPREADGDFYKNKVKCLTCGRIWEVFGGELLAFPRFTGNQLGPVKGGGKRERSGKRDLVRDLIQEVEAVDDAF